MKNISVADFKKVLELEKDDDSVDFINVCELAEYDEKHIEGVRNVPLSTLGSHVEELKGKKKVYIHCRSGNRSRQAIEKLTQAGVQAELISVDGGILAWDEAGYSTKSLTSRIPLMRQVFIVAGALILISYVGFYLIHEMFLYLVPVIGVGLLVSGLTGWCGMAMLLAKMPWNK